MSQAAGAAPSICATPSALPPPSAPGGIEAYEGLAEVLLERAALGGARLGGGELGGPALLVGDAGGLGLPLPLGLHQLHLVGVLPPQLHVARVPLAQPVQPRPCLPGLRHRLTAAQVPAGLGELVRLRPRQGPRGGVVSHPGF